MVLPRIDHGGSITKFTNLSESNQCLLQGKVEEMNQRGWNLHFVHADQPNLLIWILRLLILFLTAGLWTIGNSELLVFEKEDK